MDKFLDKTGLTYFWGKIKSLFVKKTDTIEISTASSNSVGSAVIGEAVTDESNYVPSGEITLQTQNVDIITSLDLIYDRNGAYLTIYGLEKTLFPISIPESAIFNGNGVNFIAEIKDGD